MLGSICTPCCPCDCADQCLYQIDALSPASTLPAPFYPCRPAVQPGMGLEQGAGQITVGLSPVLNPLNLPLFGPESPKTIVSTGTFGPPRGDISDGFLSVDYRLRARLEGSYIAHLPSWGDFRFTNVLVGYAINVALKCGPGPDTTPNTKNANQWFLDCSLDVCVHGQPRNVMCQVTLQGVQLATARIRKTAFVWLRRSDCVFKDDAACLILPTRFRARPQDLPEEFELTNNSANGYPWITEYEVHPDFWPEEWRHEPWNVAAASAYEAILPMLQFKFRISERENCLEQSPLP